MQIPWFTLLIIALFAFGVIISIRARKPRTPPKCRHCGSQKLVQISHETLDTRTYNRSGAAGFMPGNDIRLQLDQDITYHCRACNKKSTLRVTRAP